MKNSNAKRAAELVGKAHSALSSLYSKGKEKTKKAIHDKKKSIAREVIDETKRKVDKSDRVILRNAESIVREAYKGGGKINKHAFGTDEYWETQDRIAEFLNSNDSGVFFKWHNEKITDEQAVSMVEKETGKKFKTTFETGGKLIGNQYKLDVNKNGKIDSEDLAIIRGEKKMETGGDVGQWKKGVTIKRATKQEAEKNKKLLQQYWGDSGRNFIVEKRDNGYVVSYEFNLNDKMETGGGVGGFDKNYEDFKNHIKEGFGYIDKEYVEDSWKNSNYPDYDKIKDELHKRLKDDDLLVDVRDVDKVPGETYSASSDGHSGFYGIDADLQTSLEEYGFVAKSMGNREYAVVYKIDENFYDLGYITESDLDNILLGTEWADKEDIESFLSYVGDETSIDYYVRVNDFRNKLNDMFNYFGYENIMGSSYMPWDKETAYAEIGIDYAERGKNVKGSKHVHLTKGWRNPHGYKAVKGSDKNRDYSKGHPHIKVDKGFAMPHGYEAVDGVYAKHYKRGGSFKDIRDDWSKEVMKLHKLLNSEKYWEGSPEEKVTRMKNSYRKRINTIDKDYDEYEEAMENKIRREIKEMKIDEKKVNEELIKKIAKQKGVNLYDRQVIKLAESYKTKFDTGGGVGLHKHVTITKRGHRLPHGYKAVRGATKKADYSHKGVEMDLGWRLSHGYVLEKGADKKAYYKHGGGISECTTEEKMFVKALIERYMDNLSEDGKEVATSVLHKLK